MTSSSSGEGTRFGSSTGGEDGLVGLVVLIIFARVDLLVDIPLGSNFGCSLVLDLRFTLDLSFLSTTAGGGGAGSTGIIGEGEIGFAVSSVAE